MSDRKKYSTKVSQDNFINDELLATDPFAFSRFSRSSNYGFGGLGNGILRPKKVTIGKEIKSDIISPNFNDSLIQLTDKNSTAKLAEQIATSIQNRIDKAAIENKEEQPVTEVESKKSPVLIGSMIVGGLIITGILIYVFKKTNSPKLKTA